MSSQRIIIQRMNHLQSVVQVFERLLDNSSLVDCTIAAEGQYLKAHRVMLAACSPYFEVLFNQENTNPIVILKDTKFEDLKAVIDFIYRGKVQISEGQRQSFANTIESLHISGMENAEQCCSDAVTAPEGLHTTLLPMSSPLVERNEMVMQQEDGNQLAVVVSEESDIPSAKPPPLVEETPVPIQSIEAFPYNQFAEECKAESSLKIVESWSESFKKAGVVGPNVLSDEENHARMLTTELIDEEGEYKVDVEETPILENSEHIAEQVTTEESTEENKDESAGVAPEAAGTAPSDIVLTTQETKVTTKQNAATTSGEKGSVKNLPLLIPTAEQNKKKAPYICTQCNKSFSYRKTLVSHEFIHTGRRPHSCKICSKSFKRKHHLRVHLSTHLKHRPYSCAVCPKSFVMKSSLVVHERIHSGERPFTCTECHKSFHVKHCLIEHQQIHTTERRFSCPLCEKSFRRKSNLAAHERIHTGQRFACTICDKSFSVKHTLRVHLRTHTGLLPFSCDICGKSFRVRQSIVEHLRTHTGQRPFSCPLCEKSFTNKSNLTSHQHIHTRQQQFTCAHCEGIFTRKSTLIKHLQIHKGK